MLTASFFSFAALSLVLTRASAQAYREPNSAQDQLKNEKKKKKNPYSVLIWICSLLLLPGLASQMCVPAQWGRQGRSRKRFWEEQRNCLLASVSAMWATQWTYTIKYYIPLYAGNDADWFQRQNNSPNAGIIYLFFSFFLGLSQVICGNPIKALRARRLKLGVCFSCILHVSAWSPT